ncbi:putative AlkP superfamily pyrophosphatase or phosphodiesterase [Nitrospirillum amazonense]|uniref:Putative AlkP superfamily pyrophosphatase or phosphodiesterase n=1 Tax=Nitrospirillum amazonense TaxID=28077 RepID=A0A560FTD2_9PROT|nr:alkaline phosphatase family protein [Nitrospirillum amazonense]TWB24821.1 putative AlkP superfamily pyrophosphatase or phosphodiesterase [Nitrospirillum amazonense]
MMTRWYSRMVAPLMGPVCAVATLLAVPAVAADAEAPAPKLIVLVSVDQFSTDLFQQYRSHFTGGLRRLTDGAVFPNGYQSHAATETCPGHSTLMTGDHPARTGIIANDWYSFKGPRPGKIYCAEDESKGSYKAYVPSDVHLKVPTLGERMKAADPDVRTVSVAGKDRAAIMMGGHAVDELWFWKDGQGFISYEGRTAPAAVAAVNEAAMAEIAKPAKEYAEPEWCKAIDMPVAVERKDDVLTVGNGRFARQPGPKAEAQWRASPAFDAAIVDLAVRLIKDMKLGHGKSVDVLTVGASATDYIGHSYGTEGSEMCIQVANLDRTLGKLVAALDATGVDYVLALSADHGGNDIPERERLRGMPMAARVDDGLVSENLGKKVAPLGVDGAELLFGGGNGDVWVGPTVAGTWRTKVLNEALALYRADPQVAAVYTAAEVAAAPAPTGAPDAWSLLDRARASFDPSRSGDLVVFLKPRITAIPSKPASYIATHGSPWDYDRRVPILFWRKGITAFEQPLSVETVDIMPTLAALVGFKLAPGEVDGRCVDLDGGPGDTCPASVQ